MVKAMVRLWVVPAVLVFLGQAALSDDEGRYLVYTSGGGVFKFIIGFGVPVTVPVSLIFAHNFQFQYQAVDNATEWTFLVQNGILRSLSFSRQQLYRHLQSFIARNGGKADCVLKFICEISETPIESSGLVGELLQTIFKPDADNSTYRDAWDLGLSEVGCNVYDCPHGHGFLDQISLIY